MKKFISLILSAAFLLPLIIFNVAASDFSTEDALKILRFSIGASSISAEEKARYDIDGDGKITSSDALEVLRIVAGIKEMSVVVPEEPEEPELHYLPQPNPLIPLGRPSKENIDMVSNFLFMYHSEIENTRLRGYYGTYKGYDTIMMSVERSGGGSGVSPAGTMSGIYIDGFSFDTQYHIYACNGDIIMTLGEAYDKKLINKNDIHNVHYYFYQEYYESPLPPRLSADIEERVRSIFFSAAPAITGVFFKDWEKSTYNDIIVLGPYAIFDDNYIAIALKNKKNGVTTSAILYDIKNDRLINERLDLILTNEQINEMYFLQRINNHTLSTN